MDYEKKENESPVLLPVGSLTDQPIAKAEPEDEGKRYESRQAVTVSGQAHFMGDSSTNQTYHSRQRLCRGRDRGRGRRRPAPDSIRKPADEPDRISKTGIPRLSEIPLQSAVQDGRYFPPGRQLEGKAAIPYPGPALSPCPCGRA